MAAGYRSKKGGGGTAWGAQEAQTEEPDADVAVHRSDGGGKINCAITIGIIGKYAKENMPSCNSLSRKRIPRVVMIAGPISPRIVQRLRYNGLSAHL
jgi:hypothetical protein